MLILPPSYRTKVLMAVPQAEWRAPSLAQPKDQFGNENRTKFRLTARLADGHPVWRGWFDDRDDADAFLFALARHLILNEPMPRELWDLPSPGWVPGLGEQISYDLATVSFLTSPTGSNQTYTSPSDWNSANNSIELIAGGGSGSNTGTTNHGTGAGGGEYGKTTNFSFASPGTTTATYRIAAGAIANGADGADGWWNGTTQAGATLGAVHGSAGALGSGSQSGGVGGTGGVGTTHRAGGRGGNLTGGSGSGASGGGGAGGITNAGNNGGDSASTSTFVITAGGAGDGGLGGAGSPGSTSTSANGGSGTEWDASHGSGGGSGGASVSGTVLSGDGGTYGGGSGGAVGTARNTGPGGQGIIVVTYSPALYPRLERGIRGLNRGHYTGTIH